MGCRDGEGKIRRRGERVEDGDYFHQGKAHEGSTMWQDGRIVNG